MRGSSSGYSFSKSWDVYGIRNGDENNKNNWKLLGQNDTTQSTYCKTISSTNSGCKDGRTGTFSLSTSYLTEGFKHLRWVGREFSPSDRLFFTTSGIDVYGTLVFSNIIPRNTCRYTHKLQQFMISVLLSFLIG